MGGGGGGRKDRKEERESGEIKVSKTDGKRRVTFFNAKKKTSVH